MFQKKKEEKTEKAFGKIPAYCKYELFMERYRSAAEFIKNAHKDRNKLILLDVGCGEGYLKYFCDFRKIEFCGIEIWKKRFEVCKKLGYKMYNCDIDNKSLPFKDKTFDVVVGSHVIEHLKNREFALKEMLRVLKKGGLLIIAVPIKPIIISHLINFIWWFIPKGKGDTVHAFSLYAFKSFLKKALDEKFEYIDVRGFRIISSRRKANWENHPGFYKFNTWFGRYFPSITPEVNAIMKKQAD